MGNWRKWNKVRGAGKKWRKNTEEGGHYNSKSVNTQNYQKYTVAQNKLPFYFHISCLADFVMSKAYSCFQIFSSFIFSRSSILAEPEVLLVHHLASFNGSFYHYSDERGGISANCKAVSKDTQVQSLSKSDISY